MQRAHFTIAAAAALATVLAGSALTAAPGRARSTAPLFALSERDLSATSESGCECSFFIGRTTLVRAIGNELTIRTGGGRQVCRITDEQFSEMSGGHGEAVCAGVRLSLRRTGPVQAHPQADSADWRAALTLGQGRARRTLAGRWGCTC